MNQGRGQTRASELLSAAQALERLIGAGAAQAATSFYRALEAVLAAKQRRLAFAGNLLGAEALARKPSLPGHERVYAIGDIHGRLDLFERLVEMIKADNETRGGSGRVRLILLGDLIDRGPQSAALMIRCREFARDNPNFVVLKGNHEQSMIDALTGNYEALEFWRKFGGDETLRSWGVPEAVLQEGNLLDIINAAKRRIPLDMLAWLDASPLTYQVGSYLFVHAGIRPGLELSKQTASDLLWIRGDFLDSDMDHACVVVHGHSISDDAPDVRRNRIGIDTGAYRTGRLTALGLEAEEQWTLTAQIPPQTTATRRPRTPRRVAMNAELRQASGQRDQLERNVDAIFAANDKLRSSAAYARASTQKHPAIVVATSLAIAVCLIGRPTQRPVIPFPPPPPPNTIRQSGQTRVKAAVQVPNSDRVVMPIAATSLVDSTRADSGVRRARLQHRRREIGVPSARVKGGGESGKDEKSRLSRDERSGALRHADGHVDESGKPAILIVTGLPQQRSIVREAKVPAPDGGAQTKAVAKLSRSESSLPQLDGQPVTTAIGRPEPKEGTVQVSNSRGRALVVAPATERRQRRAGIDAIKALRHQ